jgi:rare lipoprotein A
MTTSKRTYRVAGYILLGFGILANHNGCSTGSVTTTNRYEEELEGVASYYAHEFHGRTTASGETYDMNALTAAHRTLPFHTRVRVMNLENSRSIEVRINDRGPFKEGRVIDLSFKAALELGIIARGTAPVRIQILEFGSPDPK